MGIPVGTCLYGHVDRVPGVCTVATQYFHVAYVPLLPMQSFIVFEGSEDDDGFRGVPTQMNGRSVLFGYVQGLSLLLAYTLGLAFMFSAIDSRAGVGWVFGGMFGGAALGAIPYWALKLAGERYFTADADRATSIMLELQS